MKDEESLWWRKAVRRKERWWKAEKGQHRGSRNNERRGEGGEG